MGTRAGTLWQRLPEQPSSVGEARRLVRRCLARAGRDDLVDTGELLVSEVVTNALIHAGTPIEVTCSVGRGGLEVEVGDGSPHLPSRRSYASTAGTGRGLMLLEQMVDDWGVVPNPPGKTVWFRVSSGDQDEMDAAIMEGMTEPVGTPRGETATVRFLNVPLLLHAAWEEHAQTLLREYLLANLDLGNDAIRPHAEATDAMALVAERFPQPDIGLEPNEVMGDAVEPRVSSPRVDVQIPIGSLPHFNTLDQALESAAAMADNGVVLTPPTQPELRFFRRWLCEQVDAQSKGLEPAAWSVEAGSPPASHHAPAWDSTPVTESVLATIAADDANRIIAVSQPALDLLGYDRQQLVGQRIVTIVPARYRQAHIAGFTMHLLVGRSPLIGRTVVVPATRRDGQEIEVELNVSTQMVADGRKVFIAELRET